MPHFKSMSMPPSQLMLFGRSVEEAVPVDSDVRVFSDVMECFDYSGLESKCSERGCPPYPPRVMVKVLGYAYSKGIRVDRPTYEELATENALLREKLAALEAEMGVLRERLALPSLTEMQSFVRILFAVESPHWLFVCLQLKRVKDVQNALY